MKRSHQSLKFSGHLTWTLSVLLFAQAAFGGEDIKVYQVPKEKPAAPASIPAGHPEVSEPPMPRLTWTTPAGWTEMSPGEMRAASFSVKGEGGVQADVSVIPLPGLAGGDLPNVNRWRTAQLGLTAITAEEMAKIAEPVEIAGASAQLYDLAGTNPSSGDKTRILAAIQHRDGAAWFYKMSGDDALVAKQKPAFLAFLKSAKFEAAIAAPLPHDHPPIQPATLPADHPPLEPATLPAGHPEVDGAAPAKATESASGKGALSCKLPQGWKEIPGGEFLYAKFSIAGKDGASAVVNISTSVGDGGGLAANVNRWRGQLGLPAWNDTELQKQVKTVEASGGKVHFVEMSGKDSRTGQAASVLGAVTTRGNSTWFFKLMGDAKLVESQKALFTQFVREVKY